MAKANKSVEEYLSISQNINAIIVDNLREIRRIYQEITKVDDLDDHPIDEKAIDSVCERLNLCNDGINREYMRLCVKCDEIYASKLRLNARYRETLILSDGTTNPRPIVASVDSSTTILKELTCLLIKKMDTKEIQDFIDNFLLEQIVSEPIARKQDSAYV